MTTIDEVRAAAVEAIKKLESPYLSEPEAAKYLRIGGSTLSSMRSRGGGPKYRKHGRMTLYRLADLDEWSNARVLSSVAEERAK